MKRIMIIAAVILVAVIAGYSLLKTGDSPQSSVALAKVTVPQLSGAAKAGEALFNEKCATCHGDNAAGRDGMAPPLVHKIYEPGHHGDAAFFRAAKQGVRAHHWRFGNMPPVPGVSDDDVAKIVGYVRELQRANGIF